MVKKLLVCGLGIALTGCFQPMKPSAGHMQDPAPSGASNATIPPPVQAVPAPPKPRPIARAETYSVVVNNVNVRELLFALARDAKVNVDIHPGISGAVTLNAIDQTLPQLLNRIAKQVDMRYELDGPNLLVMPDSPYLRIYKIDYVNMSGRRRARSASRPRSSASRRAGRPAGRRRRSSGGGGAGQNTSRAVGPEPQRQPLLGHAGKERRRDAARDRQDLPAGGAVARPAARSGTGAPGTSRGCAGAGPSRSRMGAAPNVTFREASSVIANPEASILTVRATSAPAREAPGVSRPGADERQAPGADRGDDRRSAASATTTSRASTGASSAALPVSSSSRARSTAPSRRPRPAAAGRRSPPADRQHPHRRSTTPPTSRPRSSCSRPSATCACSRARGSARSTTRRRS